MKGRNWNIDKVMGKERRREIVYDLWIKEGVNRPDEIQKILKEDFNIEVTSTTISQDLREIRNQAIEQSIEDVKAQTLARYDMIFKESLKAWEDSIGEIETIIEKEGYSKKTGDYEEKQTKTEKSTGLSSHLSRAQSALDSIKSVWGLDANKEIKIKVESEMKALIDYLESTLSDKTFNEVLQAIMQYQDKQE